MSARRPWIVFFHGGPLDGRRRRIVAAGEPPEYIRVDKGRLLARRGLGQLRDSERLYTLIHVVNELEVAYKWFEGFVCDFCAGRPVRWDYPGRDFTTEGPVEASDFASTGGGWAVCDPCHDLIERTDREGLFRRTIASQQRDHGPLGSVLVEALRKIQDDFWANREGAPVRWRGPRAPKR